MKARQSCGVHDASPGLKRFLSTCLPVKAPLMMVTIPIFVKICPSLSSSAYKILFPAMTQHHHSNARDRPTPSPHLAPQPETMPVTFSEVVMTTLNVFGYASFTLLVLVLWLALAASFQAPAEDPSSDILVQITLCVLSFGVPYGACSLLYKPTPPTPPQQEGQGRPQAPLLSRMFRSGLVAARQWAPGVGEYARTGVALGAVTFVGAFTHEVFLKMETGEDFVARVVTWFVTGCFQMAACYLARLAMWWAFNW